MYVVCVSVCVSVCECVIMCTSFTPFSIILLAMGACPCPRERAWKRLSMPVCSASVSSPFVGSCVCSGVCMCVCCLPTVYKPRQVVYAYTVHGMHIIVRTTPAERTKMSGILHVESSTTSDIRSTGGSTNLHKPHNYICISRRSHHTTVVS